MIPVKAPDKTFSREPRMMALMRDVAFQAGEARLAGIRPKNYRWLHDAVDFVWPDTAGNLHHMDAYEFLALYSRCVQANHLDLLGDYRKDAA